MFHDADSLLVNSTQAEEIRSGLQRSPLQVAAITPMEFQQVMRTSHPWHISKNFIETVDRRNGSWFITQAANLRRQLERVLDTS